MCLSNRFVVAILVALLGSAAGSVSATSVRLPVVYPKEAMEQCIEGWVLLRFSITELGAVENVEVVDAEPLGIFEKAAIEVVSKWEYPPRIEDGAPVAVHGVEHKITFELDYDCSK